MLMYSWAFRMLIQSQCQVHVHHIYIPDSWWNPLWLSYIPLTPLEWTKILCPEVHDRLAIFKPFVFQDFPRVFPVLWRFSKVFQMVFQGFPRVSLARATVEAPPHALGAAAVHHGPAAECGQELRGGGAACGAASSSLLAAVEDMGHRWFIEIIWSHVYVCIYIYIFTSIQLYIHNIYIYIHSI